MPFDLPEGGGGTITNKTNIITKIPDGLKSLRDGSSNTYGGTNTNTVGGSADAITLTTEKFPFTAYAEGHEINIVPVSTNTGPITISLDGLAPAQASKRHGSGLLPLIPFDIGANIVSKFIYDSSGVGRWILSEDPDKASLTRAQSFLNPQTVQSLFPQFITETTGQTAKGRIIEYDSRIFMSWNGYRDAAGWQRDDTTFPSWLFGMGAGSGDIISAFYSPAGTGLVVFVPVFSFDSSGKMTGGTVPLARTEGEERSVSVNFPVIPVGGNLATVIPGYTGLSINDYVLVTMDPTSSLILLKAYVTSATDVTVRAFNMDNISIDLPLATFYAKVIKRV